MVATDHEIDCVVGEPGVHYFPDQRGGLQVRHKLEVGLVKVLLEDLDLPLEPGDDAAVPGQEFLDLEVRCAVLGLADCLLGYRA